MEPTDIEKQIAVVLAAPGVTIVAACILVGVVWKLMDWAYKLRIDALVERLGLANDRLTASNEELKRVQEEVRQLQISVKSTETFHVWPSAPPGASSSVILSSTDRVLADIEKVIVANTATTAVSSSSIYITSGRGHWRRTDRSADE